MENRIKFKVWNNYTKRFESKGYLTSSSEADKSYLLAGVMEFEQNEDEFGDDGENVQFLQFIGIKDKNGKDIFEGDIIKTINDNWGVVVRKDHAFEVTVSETQSSLYMAEWMAQSEVIGNIYENPELLK